MKRSKKMMLLCHCLLNVNSKVEGLAETPSALVEVVQTLLKNDIGILQLPCPEVTYFGIKRWGHVVEQFETPYFREHCRNLLRPYIDQILDYKRHGYEILGILGIEGSPSCGVSLTCSADWGGELSQTNCSDCALKSVQMISGEGIFISELRKLLSEANLQIPVIGILEDQVALSLADLERKGLLDLH